MNAPIATFSAVPLAAPVTSTIKAGRPMITVSAFTQPGWTFQCPSVSEDSSLSLLSITMSFPRRANVRNGWKADTRFGISRA